LNKGLFLLTGIGCIIAVILLVSLLWHQNTDTITHDAVKIEADSTFSTPSASPNKYYEAGALPLPKPSSALSSAPTQTESPDKMPSPTLEPSASPLQPTPSPTPIDYDDLIDFYMLEADDYYSGFSSNHYVYTEEELYMLAQVITGEARGENTKGKIAVANVVMNRVLSRGYPGDTIEAVITAPGQFSGYSPSIRPTTASMNAARQVLDMEVWVIPQNVYFFRSGTSSGEDWGGHTYYTAIGGHCFYTESYRGRSRSQEIPPALYERAYKWPQFGCEPGKRVYRIQYMLNKLGYDVKADSYFGKTTKEAVIAFQTDHKMKADGIAGPSTIKALIKAYGESTYCAKFL
jgi:hypothetical protein